MEVLQNSLISRNATRLGIQEQCKRLVAKSRNLTKISVTIGESALIKQFSLALGLLQPQLSP
jgi:hypothetical protein